MRTKNIKLLFIALSVTAIVFIAYCILKPNNLSVHAPDEFYLKMSRTACLGNCPVYEIEIDHLGNVSYTGFRHVNEVGLRYDQISEDKLSVILSKLAEINFFELESLELSEREAYVTDGSAVRIYVNYGNSTNNFFNYVNENDDVTELAELIDNQVNSHRWVGAPQKY